MPNRLKFWLPTIVVTLSYSLLWYSRFWTSAMMRRVHGSVGPPPTYHFAMTLNAPITIFWQNLYGWWGETLFIAGVALLWYWVALNIISWKRTRSATIFGWGPLRVVADTVLMLFGVFLGLVFATNFHWPIFIFGFRIPQATFGIQTLSQSLSISSVTFPLAIWAASLVIWFGRDLLLTAQQRFHSR